LGICLPVSSTNKLTNDNEVELITQRIYLLFVYVFYGLDFSVLLSMYGWTTVAGKIIKLKGKKHTVRQFQHPIVNLL